MVTTVQFAILRQFMWLNNRSGIETKILNKQNIDLELQLQPITNRLFNQMCKDIGSAKDNE